MDYYPGRMLKWYIYKKQSGLKIEEFNQVLYLLINEGILKFNKRQHRLMLHKNYSFDAFKMKYEE